MKMMLLPKRQLQMPFHKGQHKSKIPIEDLESIKCYTRGLNQIFQDILNLRNILFSGLSALRKFQCHIFYLLLRQVYPT